MKIKGILPLNIVALGLLSMPAMADPHKKTVVQKVVRYDKNAPYYGYSSYKHFPKHVYKKSWHKKHKKRYAKQHYRPKCPPAYGRYIYDDRYVIVEPQRSVSIRF